MKLKFLLALMAFAACASVPRASAGTRPDQTPSRFISEWYDDASGAYVKVFWDRQESRYVAMLFGEKFSVAEPLRTFVCSPSGKNGLKLSSPDGWSGTLRSGALDLLDAQGVATVHAGRLDRKPSDLGREAPEGAVVLFDGTSLDEWLRLEPKQWTQGSGPASESAELLPDGALRLIHRDKKNGSIISRRTFSDFFLHLEFRVPFESQVNGGVYLLSKYEINIKDTFGQGAGASCCSFGNVSAPAIPHPSHNYALPPMVWQTLEVDFHAPSFGADGGKVSNARATVWFNAEKIYDDVEIEALKGAVARSPERGEGPIYLQEHGVSYDFRNIWIVEK